MEKPRQPTEPAPGHARGVYAGAGDEAVAMERVLQALMLTQGRAGPGAAGDGEELPQETAPPRRPRSCPPAWGLARSIRQGPSAGRAAAALCRALYPRHAEHGDRRLRAEARPRGLRVGVPREVSVGDGGGGQAARAVGGWLFAGGAYRPDAPRGPEFGFFLYPHILLYPNTPGPILPSLPPSLPSLPSNSHLTARGPDHPTPRAQYIALHPL